MSNQLDFGGRPSETNDGGLFLCGGAGGEIEEDRERWPASVDASLRARRGGGQNSAAR